MQCFNHPNITCRTEYPEGSVQSVCPKCSWRSSKVKIPDKIPPVQAVSLVNRVESNIFDQIYINNEVRVDSMSQNTTIAVNEFWFCRDCGQLLTLHPNYQECRDQ